MSRRDENSRPWASSRRLVHMQAALASRRLEMTEHDATNRPIRAEHGAGGADDDGPAYREILYGVADRVATVTLNVHEKRNRLSYRMRREMLDALHRAEND